MLAVRWAGPFWIDDGVAEAIAMTGRGQSSCRGLARGEQDIVRNVLMVDEEDDERVKGPKTVCVCVACGREDEREDKLKLSLGKSRPGSTLLCSVGSERLFSPTISQSALDQNDDLFRHIRSRRLVHTRPHQLSCEPLLSGHNVRRTQGLVPSIALPRCPVEAIKAV